MEYNYSISTRNKQNTFSMFTETSWYYLSASYKVMTCGEIQIIFKNYANVCLTFFLVEMRKSSSSINLLK